MPEINVILFVTQQNHYKVIFHIVNLKTKEHIQIDADSSGFGWNIGSGRKAGDKGTDYVEGVQSNRVTIATRSDIWKESLVLNLATKSIEHRETLWFDASGQVTNRSSQAGSYSK